MTSIEDVYVTFYKVPPKFAKIVGILLSFKCSVKDIQIIFDASDS